MFKFLADIKKLKRDVKEILDEFNEDFVSASWFSFNKCRTLSKKVYDLEVIVDKLMGYLKVEAHQTTEVLEQTIESIPATWEIHPKGTWDKKHTDKNLADKRVVKKAVKKTAKRA
jgi:hypothetical protein